VSLRSKSLYVTNTSGLTTGRASVPPPGLHLDVVKNGVVLQASIFLVLVCLISLI